MTTRPFDSVIPTSVLGKLTTPMQLGLIAKEVWLKSLQTASHKRAKLATIRHPIKGMSGSTAMRAHVIGWVSAAGLAATMLGAQAFAQTVESHVAAGKAAAGSEHTALFTSLCAPASGPAAPATGPRPVPERSTWH